MLPEPQPLDTVRGAPVDVAGSARRAATPGHRCGVGGLSGERNEAVSKVELILSAVVFEW